MKSKIKVDTLESEALKYKHQVIIEFRLQQGFKVGKRYWTVTLWSDAHSTTTEDEKAIQQAAIEDFMGTWGDRDCHVTGIAWPWGPMQQVTSKPTAWKFTVHDSEEYK